MIETNCQFPIILMTHNTFVKVSKNFDVMMRSSKENFLQFCELMYSKVSPVSVVFYKKC